MKNLTNGRILSYSIILYNIVALLLPVVYGFINSTIILLFIIAVLSIIFTVPAMIVYWLPPEDIYNKDDWSHRKSLKNIFNSLNILSMNIYSNHKKLFY